MDIVHTSFFVPIHMTLEIGRAPPTAPAVQPTITGSKLDFAASPLDGDAGVLRQTFSALHVMLQTAEVQFNFAAVNVHHHQPAFERHGRCKEQGIQFGAVKAFSNVGAGSQN